MQFCLPFYPLQNPRAALKRSVKHPQRLQVIQGILPPILHPYNDFTDFVGYGRNMSLWTSANRSAGMPITKMIHVISTNYSHVRLYWLNDLAHDSELHTSLSQFKLEMGKKVEYFKNIKRMGPGYCKWFLFSWVRDNSFKSDVVMVIDADDFLINPNSLSHISNIFLTKKVWFVYGSCVGRYCSQQGHISHRWSFRAQWRYSHPRCLLSVLLDHLSPYDFQDEHGSWLMKGSDRGFIYKALELSGPARIAFNDVLLYNYTESGISSYKVVPSAERVRIVKSFMTRPINPTKNRGLHLVMCVYDRLELFQHMLASLQHQELPEPIMLWICNNNPNNTEIHGMLPRFLTKFSAIVVTFPFNMGGFARFELARQIRQTHFAEYIIMLDEDVVFHTKFVLKEVLAYAKPLSFSCWYGKLFQKNGDYWKGSVINMTQIIQSHRKDLQRFHYCGTALSIIDAEIFDVDVLYSIPREFLFVEDLWLSAIALHKKFALVRLFVNVSLQRSEHELWMETGMKDLKRDFLSKLRRYMIFP
eukprot:765956-Hanusia_phi.AAC.1